MKPALRLAAISALAFLAACGVGTGDRAAPGDVAGAAEPGAPGVAPRFEVDPLWPKPLPNHWILGSTIGVSVDSRDHVWVLHRGAPTLNASTEMGAATDPPTSECCVPAPPVLEFDPEGNLVGSWGGPGEGYDWPESNHGIAVDPQDNVWLGGHGPSDAQILKFTRDGRFLARFGNPGQSGGSADTVNFGRVAKVSFDAEASEAYVADGYGNKRVAVIDMSTGAIKRYWGAYGNPPDDTPLGPRDAAGPPARQFRNPVHCAEPTLDGLVYVCDRQNDRVQVFRKDGTFVSELLVAPRTLGAGSVWDIALSRDPGQAYLYIADGMNERIWVVLRSTMEVLTTFGDGGRQPGQFFGVHSIATDSRGNIYTTETYEGKRVQKFVHRGLAPVAAAQQGTVWPGGGD